MRRILCFVLLIAGLTPNSPPALAVDPYTDGDPWWILIHEPAVLEGLDLSERQRESYKKSLDALDLRFFPLRNKSRDEALAGLAKIVADAKTELQQILEPKQDQRLQQIFYWRLGTHSLLESDVAARVRLTDLQRERIQGILEETEESLKGIKQKPANGSPREPLEKEFKNLKLAEQRKVLQILKSDQQQLFRDLLGTPFDLTPLGQPVFKVPELIDSGEWINSSAVTLAELQGKVVILHFYAFGCSNCIHNYPTYLRWQELYKNKDVVLIGIHTPETAGERESANVRRKAAEANFEFPILIDGKSKNWNAWGNSMWPSVYVIDREGYLRVFWPGELKWQGATGDKYVEDRVERLLDDSEKPSAIAKGRTLP